MRVEYHPAVEGELREIRAYYEERSPGLGAAFIDEFERQILQLAAVPERWMIVERDIRRCLMRRFPYIVYSNTMTGAEVIEEIKRLPRVERAKVLAFARQAADNQPLTPEELGELANQMVETQDPVEADRLQEKIVRGFYGGDSHA